MKRNATLNLKGLDPDVLDAARDVARRAGIPLETWIASVVEQEAEPHARRKRGPGSLPTATVPSPGPAPASLPQRFASSTAAIAEPRLPASRVPDPGFAFARAADAPPAPLVADRPAEASSFPPVSPPVEAPAPAVSDEAPASVEAAVAAPAEPPVPLDAFAASLAQMFQRLDAIDRKIDGTHEAARDAATTSVAGIEARLSTVLDGGLPPVAEMTERLATIERRMAELGEQLAQPRALGRRGRSAALEMADAVGEIRQRQRELEERGEGQASAHRSVAALQHEVAAAMEATFGGTPSSTIGELQRETSRLRDSIGGLATGQDVNALEQAVLSLASGVGQAQKPADLAAIVKPIEMIQVQVSRLAEDVAENVHARVAGDVERLADRFDRVLSVAPSDHADRDALGRLFGEIEEIRHLIAALAGPERIQSLAQGLQALSAQIAKLQGDADQDATRMAEIRPLLEEIRSDLKAPKDDGIGRQIQAMGEMLDVLRTRPLSDASGSDAIIDRIDALADKVDRVGVNPVGDLIGRLEDLGETLRRPAVPGGDLASIHSMLHDLADKVDRVQGPGAGSSGEGLDALEKQIVALSQRIETRGSDPAILGLERSMRDLLAQVGTPEAPVAGRTEIGSLKADLEELRTHQAASEQRMQATLNGVHAALDRLAGQFGGPTAQAPAASPQAPAASPQAPAASPQAPAASSPAPAAPQARIAMPEAPTPAAAPRPQGAAPKRPELPKSAVVPTPDSPSEWSRAKDEILEPGAGRPTRARPGATPIEPEPEAPAPSSSEIKSNFIAAARRAALAAQAEAAETASPKSRFREGLGSVRPASEEAGDVAGEPTPSRTGQMRAAIDKRRKHLLLGLAAVILALGGLQAIRAFSPAQAPVQEVGASADATAPSNAAPVDAGTKALGSDKPVDAEKSVALDKPAALPPDAGRADPLTTQSISTAPDTAASASPPPAAPVDPAEGAKPAPSPARKAVPKVADMGSLAGVLNGLPASLASVKKAALDGDGAAIYDLAARQAEGRGVTRDMVLAAKLFEKLAAAGYAPAQYKLAGQYEKGLGVTRDIALAKIWYGRAADQGNIRSMHNLAVIFAENPSATGKPDFVTAAQWFRRGADHGVRDSQYNLAVLHARGLGVPQDLVQSYLWFSAAAAQGDEDAGKKRDDVAGKLAPKDLATARSLAAAFKPKAVDLPANEPPAVAASAAMTLLGAPAPAPILAPKRS
ncbi:tetratricopeptide repeat protein [Methylobacterium sp. Leaf108]|uniref:tetratricopeptide repeat protein n=1 Tax=Methylobacterium sp. Leaf108 TaxID=1736256 RepID=UPI0006F87868|nr:tetratricopeptide repeat protein [Methylobacterium sp. Leaf108]KQP50423.1 hypothetical protein ASF39_12045 [Methylobacterium sp. Leaf108]